MGKNNFIKTFCFLVFIVSTSSFACCNILCYFLFIFIFLTFKKVLYILENIYYKKIII